jgi:formylglycine-generating enzyme required for sulfatase activity
MRWFLFAVPVAIGAGLVGLTFMAGHPRAARASSASVPAPAASCQDLDRDGRGVSCPAGPDCNDRDPGIHPGQKESCNGRDDDCNGVVDDDPSCGVPAHDARPVAVPASALLMGSPTGQGAADEHPLHRVELSGYAIDRYEVTNQRYAACVRAGACQPPKLPSSAKRQAYFQQLDFGDYPVVFVGWAEADRFCRWDHGRLPTEAEWELAARGPAPSTRVFPWGDEPPDCTRANLGGDTSCVGDTDLVGRRPRGASFWGVMDLAGNVWEWTADWYNSDYYRQSPERDPRGPGRGTLKVMRGGCWASGADSLRVACRKAELPNTWAPNVGFRCVRPEGR